MIRSTLLIAAVTAAISLPARAASTVECDLKPMLGRLQQIDRSGSVRYVQWVNVARADGSRAAQAAKTVQKDGTVITLRYQRERDAISLMSPGSFLLKPTWALNTRYEISADETFTIHDILDAPGGGKVYIVNPYRRYGSHYFFVRDDGAICNKVATGGMPRVALLPGTYSIENASGDAGRLRVSPNTTSDQMTVKLVYLGTAGGTSRYREVWSINGRMVAEETTEFDSEASNIEVGGLMLQQSNATANSVRIGTPDVPERIEATRKIARYLKLNL